MSEINKLVSVTIPFHNSERFLAEAIESVLRQTYTGWELILVDDGGSDQSSAIARFYAAQFPGRITCLEHIGRANLGLTRSRNLGARSGNGEILAFLDSDDIWLADKLERQVALLDEYPEAGFVYGPSEYWYDWAPDNPLLKKNSVEELAPGDALYQPQQLIPLTYPFGRYGAPCPSSLLLRRSSFERVGGFVEEFNPQTFQLYEDIAFYSKLYLQVPAYVAGFCSDRYRCHPGSMWQRSQGSLYEESARRFYFRWLTQYLRQHPIATAEVRATIRRKGWPYLLPLPNAFTRLWRRAANRLSMQAASSSL
jgi:glycosyltransferase involved in cell wall biosynthesis